MKARGEDLTDWGKVAAMTQEELDHLISEDPDERTFEPDWARAELVVPERRRSVHLLLEQDIIDFFKAQGKGHISRMQAVLRAYVNAHRSRDGG
jgi:uncharacterized protein (DUF4415 family)